MSDAYWKPVDQAPKDGTKVDIWAKSWVAEADEFAFQRFPNCEWRPQTSLSYAGWKGLPEGWRPTHFHISFGGPK